MTPRERRSALAIFAVLLPSLLALWWATQLASTLPRPGALRAFSAGGQPFIGFFFNDSLHLLDADGTPVARQPLAALALTEEPTDFDVTVDAAGHAQAWLFEDGMPRVVRCDVQAAPPRLAHCVQAMAGPQLKLQPAPGANHIAVDVARGRIFVADAKGGGVRMLDLRGRPLAATPARQLFFPNRLRLQGERLLVADNDHYQLAWLDVSGAAPDFRVRERIFLPAHPRMEGRRKAADFALQRGADGSVDGLWALAVAQGQKNGRILLYGRDHAPAGVADLGGHSDPLVIEALGEALVVADFDGLALYRIGRDGSYLGAFGGGALAAELEGARKQRQAARHWKLGAWAGLVLTFVVGCVLAWRFSERPVRAETPAPFVSADFLELAPASWFVRRLLAAQGGILLVLLLVVAIGIVPRWDRLPVAPRTWLAALAVFALAVGLAGAWRTWRFGQQRLRIADGRIALWRDGRQRAHAGLATLLASPRTLLVGTELLPYRGAGITGRPGRWIYDEQVLQGELLDRLAPGQRVSEAELGRERMRRLPRWQWATLVLPMAAAIGYALWVVLK